MGMPWAGCAALAFALPVSAAIVTTQNGVLDQATGLEWANVAGFLGTTWEQASRGIGVWRLATVDEASTFFADAGIVGTGGSGGQFYDPVHTLLRQWGQVYCCQAGSQSAFWLDGTREDGRHPVGDLAFGYNTATGEPLWWSADPAHQWLTDGEPGSEFVSAAMVRVSPVPVPEPVTWFLMLTGLGVTLGQLRPEKPSK